MEPGEQQVGGGERKERVKRRSSRDRKQAELKEVPEAAEWEGGDATLIRGEGRRGKEALTGVEGCLRGAANLPLELPLLLGSIVGEDFKAGAPPLQLHLPVQHHTGGDNDQMGAPVTCLAKE